MRGTLENSKIEEIFQQIGEMIHSLDKDIADMKASIAALTGVLAAQLSPDDPAAGLAQIQKFEQVARQADPSAEKRQSLGDVIEAVKLIRKHGSHET